MLVKVVPQEVYDTMLRDLGAKAEFIELRVGSVAHTAFQLYSDEFSIFYAVIPEQQAQSIINNLVLLNE